MNKILIVMALLFLGCESKEEFYERAANKEIAVVEQCKKSCSRLGLEFNGMEIYLPLRCYCK